MAAQGLYPDPLQKITLQIAVVGSAIVQALGGKMTAEDLLFESAAIGRKGPTGEEIERKLMMWAGAVNKQRAKRRRSSATTERS